MSRFLLALFLLQAAPPAAPPTPAPGNQSPAQPLAPVIDPAAAIFASDAGLLLVTVKADKSADYEAVIRALQAALSASTDETRRAVAQGWRVYKASAPDAVKTTVIYVHVLHPAVPNVDYRPSLLLDDLLAGASADLLAKYRDAIAVPPNKLEMIDFAHMAKPPPANATPAAPVAPKKPRP